MGSMLLSKYSQTSTDISAYEWKCALNMPFIQVRFKLGKYALVEKKF